jgi:poly(glycerol-phosphate) alpha-glucosyltransferase
MHPLGNIHPYALPGGRYLSCTAFFQTDAGGQTRAMLMRNNALVRESGVTPEILSFAPAPNYPQRREILLERGLLEDAVVHRNIFDHYREHPWRAADGTGRPLEDLGRHQTGLDHRPDGTPWRIRYDLHGAGGQVHDYLREDGSTYLRAHDAERRREPSTAPLQMVSPAGEVLGTIRSSTAWHRRWIRELTAGDDRVFLFMDARSLVPRLAQLGSRRIHLVYVMHSMHLAPPRRWDSPTYGSYTRLLPWAGHLDALVTLTDRQRQDIAQRLGGTANLFVVPHPVVLPSPPVHATRDPRRVAVIARIEPPKQVLETVEVFARVVAAVPDARLDIYGAGRGERALRKAIEDKGLSGSITLRGFDPQAREALWRSSALMLTSAYETYALVILEAMSRGCPVVSYDIKYGPREQITDRVDGFLVPALDRDAMAARVIELLRSPALVKEMGESGMDKAAASTTGHHVREWAGVLTRVVENRPRRTSLRKLGLQLVRLSVRRARTEVGGVLRVSAVVGSRSRAGAHRLRAARPELSLVDETTGDVVDLPVRARFRSGSIQVSAAAPASRGSYLRLRVVVENLVWEARLAGIGEQLGPSRPA